MQLYNAVMLGYGRYPAWLVSKLQDDKRDGISMNAEALDADMFGQSVMMRK